MESKFKQIEERHISVTTKVNKRIKNRIKEFIGPFYFKNYSSNKADCFNISECRVNSEDCMKNIDKAIDINVTERSDFTKSDIIFKVFTNTNEYTVFLTNYIEKNKVECGETNMGCFVSFENFLPDEYYNNLNMELMVVSRIIRAGDSGQKTRSLGQFPFTREGWQDAKEEILKYEILDSIKDKWKNNRV